RGGSTPRRSRRATPSPARTCDGIRRDRWSLACPRMYLHNHGGRGACRPPARASGAAPADAQDPACATAAIECASFTRPFQATSVARAKGGAASGSFPVWFVRMAAGSVRNAAGSLCQEATRSIPTAQLQQQEQKQQQEQDRSSGGFERRRSREATARGAF